MSRSWRARLAAALHALAFLALAVGVIAQLDRPMAPALPAAPPPEALFLPAFLDRVRAYRDPRYLAGLAALLLTVAVPAWWAWSARGRAWTDRVAARWGVHRPGRAAVALAVLVLVSVDLALLPLSFWAGYVQEGQFGFRTQGLAGWARDWVVAHGPVWLGAAVLTPLAVLLVRRLPRAWPAVLALTLGVLTALLTTLAPLLLEPLWLRTTPLAPGPARDAVEEVLERADAPVDTILVADASRRTTKANAYVSGIGATRRVVLYDTLLAQAPPAQIAYVVAHELAHDRHGDIARGVWLGVAGAVAAVYAVALVLGAAASSGRITGAADPRAVPLALFVALALAVAALPVQSALSRRAESAADWTALALTRDPASFAATQHTLARSHLGDPAPPGWAHWLWQSHPSARERIGMAHAWAARHGRPLPPPDPSASPGPSTPTSLDTGQP